MQGTRQGGAPLTVSPNRYVRARAAGGCRACGASAAAAAATLKPRKLSVASAVQEQCDQYVPVQQYVVAQAIGTLGLGQRFELCASVPLQTYNTAVVAVDSHSTCSSRASFGARRDRNEAENSHREKESAVVQCIHASRCPLFFTSK